ncbi:hypothetical protein DFH28DRAFT_1173220 [Melampsora americana]|nr:hypothetical protein DFH28DRAFT_1173220 [Melampsora americana]
MPPKKTPVLTKTGVPRKPRRTRAQIAADSILCGQTVKGKQSRAELKQSLLAAAERERAATEDSGSLPTPVALKGQESLASSSRSNSKPKSLAITSKADEIETPNLNSNDGPKFQLADWKHVVSALSQPKYREAIFGGGRRTNVTGLPMGTISILKPLALEINEAYNRRNQIFSRSRSKPKGVPMALTGKTLKQRLTRYKSRYFKMNQLLKGTGAGVSEKELAKYGGLKAYTEHHCPCYDEMHALFKDKGNVEAFAIVDSGLPSQHKKNDNEGSSSPSEYESDSEEGRFEEIQKGEPSLHSSSEGSSEESKGSTPPDSSHLTASNRQSSHDQQLQDALSHYPTRIGPDTAGYPNGQAPETTYFPDLHPIAYDPNLPISNATINRMIDSFPEDYDFPALPPEDHNFPSLPPPIEPPAGYPFDDYMLNIPANISPVIGPTTFPNNNKNIAITSVFPANIDPIPELEFNSEAEDAIGKRPKGRKPKKTHHKSESEEVIEQQPASTTRKKRRTQRLLTAEEKAPNSGSSNDSETLGCSKKREKQTQSRKSTGPITTIANRPMDPLPPIDSSAVRTKDIKNPIALALMTSSADRTKEIQANNLYRRNLEETKRQEAASAELRKSQEVGAALQWEKDKLHKQGKQALVTERSRLARELILAGKTPQELRDYLDAVFPPCAGSRSPSPSGPPVPSTSQIK